MKKVTKKSLDELAKVMPVLSEKEQCSFIAGTGAAVSEYEFMVQYNSGVWNGGTVDSFGRIDKNVIVVSTGIMLVNEGEYPEYAYFDDMLWHYGKNSKNVDLYQHLIDTNQITVITPDDGSGDLEETEYPFEISTDARIKGFLAKMNQQTILYLQENK